MSGTAADVIRVAESQLGCTNGAKYFNELGYADGGAWCVAFVQWCMSKAGVSFPWPPPDKPSKRFVAWDYGDCPWPVNPRDLQAGDAVSFDWDDDSAGDHVGIVVSVHDWGIKTIEGNTSGGIVAEREREWPSIVCGIRPTYSATGGEWRKSGERWWWAYPDGSWPANEWKHINGHWYYFDAQGWMVTGWVHWGDSWYFCDRTKGSTEGQMLASTCVQVDGAWYALGESGAMLTDVQTNPEHDGTYGRLIL